MPDWIDTRTGLVSGASNAAISVPRPRSLGSGTGVGLTARANRAAGDVDRIASSILSIESGGKHAAKGGSGETGGYQFMPAVWNDWSSRLSPDRRPMAQTPENEHFVAKTKIKGWLDKGLSPEQIASMWNSGSPKWEGNVGVNEHGVGYDTPAYVEKFKKSYYGR